MELDDCHIHLHHSACTADEMTVAAVFERCDAVGLGRVGLVEHLHPATDPEIFVRARAEIVACEQAKGRALLGMEVDLLDQRGNTSMHSGAGALADYLLLAMGHTQLPWVRLDVDLPPDRFLIAEAESLLLALEAGSYHIVAHPFIYALLYRARPQLAFALRPGDLPSGLVRGLAETLIRKNVVLELHCRDLFVRPQNLGGAAFVASYTNLLLTLRDMGVKFLCGSDAHRLEQVGRTSFAPEWIHTPPVAA
jgi:histidinol phosphatase-like PHP family hydrolase